MKIALISEHASPLMTLGGVDAGGQNVHVNALARGLALRGHTVDVYTRRDDPESAERVVLAPRATVVHVPAGPAEAIPKDELLAHMDAFGDWVAQDWERRGLPDVVHAHFWMSGLAALRATTHHRVPVVQTFHALGSVKRRFQGEADTSADERLELERRIAAEADLIIATCSDEVDELHAMAPSDTAVRTIPCGVDTTRFTPFGPRVEASRPQLLTVGRLVPRKGFDDAIRALALLPDVDLTIAGGPPLAALAADPEARRLQALARRLGVADRVTMLGQVDHEMMPQLYRQADIVLANPWYEPFGITPLEAAASGRPVVGSAVGGLLDSVLDGVTGRLVPARDPHRLADGIREILDDPAVGRQWGDTARERAVSTYDWTVVTRATERALLDVVRRAAPTHPTEAAAWIEGHRDELRAGMSSLDGQAHVVQEWGEELAAALPSGARLLAAGNGGSAAEAQHLTAELVGRFCGERRPLSALSLCAESSSVTAILNDYGPDEIFARQVEAHARPGDILVLLSTSGTSSNVVHAAKRGHELGMQVWALTGPSPNPLASLADSALAIDAGSTAAVQEVHLTAVHAVCAVLDATLRSRGQLVVREPQAARA